MMSTVHILTFLLVVMSISLPSRALQQQGSVELSSGLPPLSNLDAVKNHQNINLINDNCGGIREVQGGRFKRIVGGFEAAPGELPWMALLKYKGRKDDTITFNCGGTLISSFYVLTAASCVTRDLVGVRLGEHNLSTDTDCDSYNNCLTAQDIDAEKVMKHGNYSKVKRNNDIALIRLKAAADVTKKNIKPICLPTSPGNEIDLIDEETRNKMLISGWGLTENGMRSNVLSKAYVPFISNSECSKRFAALTNIKVYPTYLCAGGFNKTDTCNGDSGGPIQNFGTVGGKERMVLYGVVSAGVQCLDPELIYPGIYTNVAYYLTWILDNMTS